MPGALLNVKQVQEILGLSERTVFRLIKERALKGFKVGREWRFEESDIRDFIKQQREKTAQQIQTTERSLEESVA